MCGRYVSATPPDQIANYFDVEALGETLVEPKYNVAPTTRVPVVYEPEGTRTLDLARWGLVPSWAKEEKIGNRMINARAETVATTNAFRAAFKRRRCIIPADGFYEWQKIPGQKTKQPMYIHPADKGLFAFAGLYEVWRGPEKDLDPLFSCAIITGDPNERVAEVHDRMPVMLPASAWDLWLANDIDDREQLEALFVPAPAALVAMHPVSTEVNNARNHGAHLIEASGQDRLL